MNAPVTAAQLERMLESIALSLKQAGVQEQHLIGVRNATSALAGVLQAMQADIERLKAATNTGQP